MSKPPYNVGDLVGAPRHMQYCRPSDPLYYGIVISTTTDGFNVYWWHVGEVYYNTDSWYEDAYSIELLSVGGRDG